ncbi:hypothetical protein GGX14DRAFT_645217, partial [Mycena pura]
LAGRARGTNNVVCDTSNTDSVSICRQLVNSLNVDPSTIIGNSPCSICLGQGGNECCVSWSVAAGNIQKGDLFNAANDILGTCGGGSTVSGFADNVDLSGTCTDECLSNRATHCS